MSKILTDTIIPSLKSKISSMLNNKQDKLVSGANIKTVNNNSLLGSGNVTISASHSPIEVDATVNSSNQITSLSFPASANNLELGEEIVFYLSDYCSLDGQCQAQNILASSATATIGNKTYQVRVANPYGEIDNSTSVVWGEPNLVSLYNGIMYSGSININPNTSQKVFVIHSVQNKITDSMINMRNFVGYNVVKFPQMSTEEISKFFGGSYSYDFYVPKSGNWLLIDGWSAVFYRKTNALNRLNVTIRPYDSTIGVTPITYYYPSTTQDTEFGGIRRTLSGASVFVPLETGVYTLYTSGNLYYDNNYPITHHTIALIYLGE